MAMDSSDKFKQIKEFFPGAKVTVILRKETYPGDFSCVVMSDDADQDAVCKEIEKSLNQEKFFFWDGEKLRQWVREFAQ